MGLYFGSTSALSHRVLFATHLHNQGPVITATLLVAATIAVPELNTTTKNKDAIPNAPIPTLCPLKSKNCCLELARTWDLISFSVYSLRCHVDTIDVPYHRITSPSNLFAPMLNSKLPPGAVLAPLTLQLILLLSSGATARLVKALMIFSART